MIGTGGWGLYTQSFKIYYLHSEPIHQTFCSELSDQRRLCFTRHLVPIHTVLSRQQSSGLSLIWY